MRERPILMSGWNVRRILDGAKTETRRAVRPQPGDFDVRKREEGWFLYLRNSNCVTGTEVRCPFGQPGDHLYVRETWQQGYRHEDFMETEQMTWYAADERLEPEQWPAGLWSVDKWRPSIHMPKRLARLWLDVAEVRAERLQEITFAGIEAEGLPSLAGDAEWHHPDGIHHFVGPVAWFANLWDELNAKRGYGWLQNPWVWVVRFKVQEAQR